MKRFVLLLTAIVLSLFLFACNECEHEWSDATCTEPKTCTLCGETDGDAKGHAYGEWIETKAKTCTENGEKTRSCACGNTEKSVIPASHDTVSHEAKAASCTVDGYKAYVTCSNCDYTTFEAILASHDIVEHEAKTETCTAIGYKAYVTCNKCSYTTYEEIPIADHDTEEFPRVESSCSVAGNEAYVACKNCPYTTYAALPLEDHDLEGHYGQAASCTKAGYKPYYTCNNCSYTTYEAIPIQPHKTDIFPEKAATCTSVGNYAYEKCKNCTYSTYVEIPMKDHDYVSEVTLPTCEAGGYTTHTCTQCPASYVDNEVGAHGHAYGDWFVSTKITSANSNGEMSRNCLNCMKPEKKPIAVLHFGNMGGYLPTDPVNKNTITDAVQWKLYEDGTLKLEGTGVTAEANWDGNTQPYKAYRDQIKRAIVGEGITYIRGGAFAYMPNLEEYELPSTLYHMTGNTFMQSFKKGITEFTVPANVTYLGICIAGPYTSNVTNTALFNDIYIENPNVTFHPKSPNKGNGELYISFNSYVKYNPNLTIYSHGTSNNVKTYCDTYGIRYVDLDSSVFGEVDNLKYSVLEGKMLLSAKDPSKPVTLPASQPWLEKLSKSDISSIEITALITDIPASYFKDYTALTTVNLPTTVETIGSEAFATTSANSTALTIQLYDALTAVSSDFLKNRTKVTVNGIFGTVLDNFKQTGVTLNLKKSIKILLIGNSLSQDAADYTSNNKQSQLYNIIKSMTGPNCYVKIGALCAGAKTAGWHATMAESNAPEYLFSVISDDTNGLWTSTSGVSSIQALTSDKWDYITIQPYASEAVTGTGSKADTDTKYEPAKAEKFYALSASLPYLLDHFDKYCPDAKVYYYLTWSNYYSATWTSSSNLALNGAEDEFINKRLPVARTAMTYTGTNSGKGFDGLIAGGTAIQIARSTYLGTQFYTTYNNPPAANKPDTTSWIGLQRDDVHLSFSTGRYIVGLAFAEVLVPEEYRLDTYTLPDIAPTVKGELPKHHTTLAQLCVAKMLETSQLEGNDKYKVVRLEDYTVEPTA